MARTQVSKPSQLNFLQGAGNLRLAANMFGGLKVQFPRPPLPGINTLSVQAHALQTRMQRQPPAHSCQQRLALSFYFDGPGHQLQSDDSPGALSLSNVAKLYRVRRPDSASEGIFSFYIPGLAAPFPEINDPGEFGPTAFERQGEARLQWALKKLAQQRAATSALCGIDVYLFGYSRGAALTRAFANRLSQLGRAVPDGILLHGTSDVVLSVQFMGLWDTVAAIGPPINPVNESALGTNIDEPNKTRSFKTPLDDPAPPPAETVSYEQSHPGWTREMAIPSHVKSGVHIIAGHENQNSLPVETTLHGVKQPKAFQDQEFIYPGRQIDVGGGHPINLATGGNSLRHSISSITLNVMFEKAQASGAPLLPLLSSAVMPATRYLFAAATAQDPDTNQRASKTYAETVRAFNAYLEDFVGEVLPKPDGRYRTATNKSLGAWFAGYRSQSFVRRNALGLMKNDIVPIYIPLRNERLPHYAALDAAWRSAYKAKIGSPQTHLTMSNRIFLDAVSPDSNQSQSDETHVTDPRVAYVGGLEKEEFTYIVPRVPDCGFAVASDNPPFDASVSWGDDSRLMWPRAAYTLGDEKPYVLTGPGVHPTNHFSSLPSRPVVFAEQTVDLVYPPHFPLAKLSRVADALAGLPSFLRGHVDNIRIEPDLRHDPIFKPADAYTGIPTGTIGRIIVLGTHWWENDISSSRLYYVLVHEAAHLSVGMWDLYGINGQFYRWTNAIKSDLHLPSKYAGNNPREDFAEFSALFVNALYTECEVVLKHSFPARYKAYKADAELVGFKRDLSLSDWPE